MNQSESSKQKITNTNAYRAVLGAWSDAAVIACSGGTDSTALVLVAAEALRRKKIAPFTVCHVDHRSRPDSAKDAEPIAALCRSLDVPFVAAVVDQASEEAGGSREAIWREQRYRALFDVADKLDARVIVTAHTQDDQAETVLMHAFSGSGWRGMEGRVQRWDRDQSLYVIRPLISVARSELLDVVRIAGVTPLEDPSNEDLSFRRNAVRHAIMPKIREVYPGFEKAIVRSAAIQSDDTDYCDLEAGWLFSEIAQVHPEFNEVVVKRQQLRDGHIAMSSRIILKAARELIQGYDTREMSYERVMSVVDAIHRSRSGAVIELPYGIRVEVKPEFLVFRSVVGESET